MSKQTKQQIACPKCKNEQKYEAWSSINTTLNPELKGKLLTRELVTFKCEKCGHQAEVAHNILYHDMEQKLMIWLVHNENPEKFVENAAAEMQFLMQGYTLRITTTLNKLIEKIRIFDDGHNDKAIELLKIGIAAQEKKDHIQELYYDGLKKITDQDSIIKIVAITDKGMATYTLPWNPENNKTTQPLDHIEKGKQLNEEKWLLIDEEYAIHTITKAGRTMKNL